SLNKQARTITTGTDGCLTLSISRGADLQATLDDLWSWIGYLMLNTGDTALDHEPYRPASPSPESPSPILSLEDFDVVVRGRNLFDLSKISTSGINRTAPLDVQDKATYLFSANLKNIGIVGIRAYDMNGNDSEIAVLRNVSGLQIIRFTADFSCYQNYFVRLYNYAEVGFFELMLIEDITDTIPPYTPYYRQDVPVPFALRAVGDGKDQLAVDQNAKKVTVTRHVDPEKIDPAKSIYDNPDQYLLDQPVVEDITGTATGQALLQLATCYPDSIIDIECDNGLTGTMQAQVLVLGR
ncbi:MAG: hypothetical protein UGF45_02985, partial [Massilioclostridium sp.]|nr:hypothetical protein [Massilioclostridium sp.]